MKTDQARVSSKYAEAVIDLAFESGDKMAEDILQDLKAINQVVGSTPDFTVVLNHPSVSGEQKKKLLIALFEGQVQDLTLRLLNLLADKRRLDLLSQIEHEYLALLRVRKNVLTARLTSAEALSEKELAAIKNKLSQQLGKQFDLDVKVDSSLIGGVVLRVGDQVLDGSLKGKLQVLERSLLSV